MHTYRFKAMRKRERLLIDGWVHGTIPGQPYLQAEISPDPGICLLRLCFRATDPEQAGFTYLVPRPSPAWHTIRILLPCGHEYHIPSRQAAALAHGLSRLQNGLG